MVDEMTALNANGTWEVVLLPSRKFGEIPSGWDC